VEKINVCQGEIFELYTNRNMRFKTNVFAGYKVLLVFTHDSIIMCWMLNLNFGVEHLAFNVNQ
jgi:hypothetical protein